MKKKNVKHRRTKKKIRIKKTRFFLLLIMLALVVFLVPRFKSAAKYVYNIVHEYYLSSKDFYFASDKLSINHTEYELTNNWSGAEMHRIPINMTSKKNDKAVTDADITYTISVTKSDNITATPSKQTGTILGNNHAAPGVEGLNEDYFEVYISPSGGSALPEGSVAWVEITVQSISPYEQTLTGKIYVEVGSAKISYEIIDAVNQPYLTVNITNSQSVGANVTLNYSPAAVLLDMTDRFYLNATNNTSQQISNYTYLNSITSYVDSLSTTSVKFYKVDATQNYSYTGGAGTPIITLTTPSPPATN